MITKYSVTQFQPPAETFNLTHVYVDFLYIFTKNEEKKKPIVLLHARFYVKFCFN